MKRSRGQSAEAPSRRSWWNDRAARLRFPLPDPFDELLAPEPLLIDLRLGELVGDDDLCCDAGMIGTGLP